MIAQKLLFDHQLQFQTASPKEQAERFVLIHANFMQSNVNSHFSISTTFTILTKHLPVSPVCLTMATQLEIKSEAAAKQIRLTGHFKVSD